MVSVWTGDYNVSSTGLVYVVASAISVLRQVRVLSSLADVCAVLSCVLLISSCCRRRAAVGRGRAHHPPAPAAWPAGGGATDAGAHLRHPQARIPVRCTTWFQRDFRSWGLAYCTLVHQQEGARLSLAENGESSSCAVAIFEPARSLDAFFTLQFASLVSLPHSFSRDSRACHISLFKLRSSHFSHSLPHHSVTGTTWTRWAGAPTPPWALHWRL